MIRACEFNKKSFAFVEATHYCTNRWKFWIKITRDFTCKRVFIYLFIFCHVNGVKSVRSGLSWVGLANSLSKGSTYLCANFYPQCCPTVQVGCCGSGHQVCIPGGEEEGLISYLGQLPLKSFLEGNVSSDFLFHSIKPLMAEGGTRKCNLEPENTATLNKIGILLLIRREICILDIQQKLDYSL